MRLAFRVRHRIATGLTLLVLFAVLGRSQAGQRIWARYEHEMQDPVDDPPDALRKGEFALGRLRYRSPLDGGRYSRWGIDANKGDRVFISILNRLTRIDVQPIETIIDIDKHKYQNYTKKHFHHFLNQHD